MIRKALYIVLAVALVLLVVAVFPPHAVAPGLVGLLLVGSLGSVAQDHDLPFASDTTRQQYSKLAADFYYYARNRCGTVAAVCAQGGTAQKVKTTANTTYICGGAPIAKSATDDLWTLTGGILAISSFRKYRLLLDASGAATVQASSDAAAAVSCAFSARPADGTTIIGQVTVATDASHTFTPATTALNATGITATFIDGSDTSEMLASTVTP